MVPFVDSVEEDIFWMASFEEAGMVPFVDSVEEDSFWMGSFGEDTVEVNWVEGESPGGSLLSMDSFTEYSSFAIGMAPF